MPERIPAKATILAITIMTMACLSSGAWPLRVAFDLRDDPDFHWVEVSTFQRDRWSPFEFAGRMACQPDGQLFHCSLPMLPAWWAGFRLRTCTDIGGRALCSDPTSLGDAPNTPRVKGGHDA